MKKLLYAGALVLLPVRVFGQTSSAEPDLPPTTSPGHELAVGLGGYDYVEPGDLRISIHGAKFAGEYAGTFSLNARRHWFARTNVRASLGSTSYDGWCAPWLITPNSASPNGYLLDIGDFSPCNDTGNRDWYLEGRALAGRDFVGQRWTWSPEAGLAVRHLSNALADVAGYRTDEYLYLPVGLTVRTVIASHSVLSLNVEYDHLIRGWQKTRDSQRGGGDVAATATAPAFTINSFSDVSFDQHRGRALRASAKYEMNRRWSVQPYWIQWSVDASTVSLETAKFTVNGTAARQPFGAFEPQNTTNEVGVKFGFRIR